MKWVLVITALIIYLLEITCAAIEYRVNNVKVKKTLWIIVCIGIVIFVIMSIVGIVGLYNGRWA